MPHFIADLAVLLGFSHLVAARAEIEIFGPFVQLGLSGLFDST